MKEYIVALVKVFKEKAWAENFRNGQLYMNPISYFIKSDQEQVADPSEATAIALKFKAEIGHQQHNYSVRIIDTHSTYNPVFCMYAVYSSDYNRDGKIRLLSDKMKEFGKYAVVVNNVRAFLEKITEKEKQLDYSCVKYINFSTIKEDAIFYPILKKNLAYEHQKEFRIFSDTILVQSNYTDAEKDELDSLKFVDSDHYDGFIDDINDITSGVLYTDELINGVNLNLSIGWNFCRKTNLDLTTEKMWRKNRRHKQ